MSTEEKTFSYYKFKKDLGYEVYLRFEDFEFENQFTDVLNLIGFDKVERDKVKDKNFNPYKTKILKIVKANARVARQINRASFEFGDYGVESVSQMGSYDVYRYKGIGMMIIGEGTLFWELGIKSTHDQVALRTILTRFISFALAPVGVVGFWGVPIEEGFVVMSPKESKFEALFVDLEKSILITYDGIKNLDSDIQILRLDNTLRNEMKKMKREQLLSFLTMNTSHLSYKGTSPAITETILELTELADGYVYPETNFKPRLGTE